MLTQRNTIGLDPSFPDLKAGTSPSAGGVDAATVAILNARLTVLEARLRVLEEAVANQSAVIASLQTRGI